MPTGYNTQGIGSINATIYQIAKLNDLLPPGYRIELYENLGKIKGMELKSGKRQKIVRCIVM
jgi:hypothetical protein